MSVKIQDKRVVYNMKHCISWVRYLNSKSFLQVASVWTLTMGNLLISNMKLPKIGTTNCNNWFSVYPPCLGRRGTSRITEWFV